MDNASGTGLPPLAPLSSPGIVSPAPMGQPAYPPRPAAPGSMGLPGRPLSDPEQQAAKAEKTAEQRNLERMSPGRAKDYKLKVFRTGSDGRSRGKEVLTLLSSQLNDALRDVPQGEAYDEALDDLIIGRLPENAPDGIYKCQWYDKTNRAVPAPPPWELEVGEGGGATAELAEEEELMEEERVFPPVQSFTPPPPAAPPAPPALDLAAVGGALRAERNEESKRSSETMTLIISMQQMQQQNMQAMQQQAQQQQAQQQQWQREAEERDRQRRAEFRQTLMAMLPMVLPMIQQMFSPKTGMSAEMTALLDLMKSQMAGPKGPNMEVMFENMMKMNGEMTKQAMELQRSGATVGAQMQAEATSMTFKHLMNTLKETMDMNKAKPEKEEESVLGTIAKIAGPLIAAAQQNQQPAQAPVAQPEAAPQAPAPQRAAAQPSAKVPPPAPAAGQEQAPPAAPRSGRRRQAAPPRPQVDPATQPDDKRITACLTSVRRMSIGELPPERRWHVIQWMTEWLPPSMIEALKAKDRSKVQELGTPAVLGNSTLLQWITDEDNQSFLDAALEDVRKLVTGEATEEGAAESVRKAQEFLAKRQGQVQKQDQDSRAAAERHANVSDTPPPAPPKDAQLVTDVSAAVAPPPVDATVVPPPVPPAPPAAP